MAELELGSMRAGLIRLSHRIQSANRPMLRYGIAMIAAIAAASVHFYVSSLSIEQADLLLMVPAVLVAAAFGGLGPALLATGLCLLFHIGIAAITSTPMSAIDLATAAAFALVGIAIASCGERLRLSRYQAQLRAEDLVAREAHLQSLLATIPDAVIIIDDQGIIRYFSSSAERLFDYTADEAIGQNVKIVVPTPDREAHDGYIRRYVQTAEPHIIGIGRVAVGERKDGSTFPIALAVGEMTSQGRKYFTGYIRDLTERQETEQRLQELQAEVVHISRLTAMGEMASALAHELNQPLSAIANYLTGSRRLLAEASDDNIARVRIAIDAGVEQSLRAGQIIRRLRDFVARHEPEKRIESLRKLIEEASALALVGAREMGIRVQLRFDPAVDQVIVDKVQIQQVLLNLMRNAVEAMEDSARRELIIASHFKAPDNALVEVADTGCGLSPEISAQIFQPFATTKTEGMGIGLSISRAIIESHEGHIWAEANPGGGTVFRFTLPAVVNEELADVG